MHRRPAHRIYCETLPYAELQTPATLALLRRFDLQVVLAVRPWQQSELPRVARVLADAGVRLSVWPMLADEDGRWASVHNVDAFVSMVRSVARAFEGVALPLEELLFDLEPPFGDARALSEVGTKPTDRSRAIAAWRIPVRVPALVGNAVRAAAAFRSVVPTASSVEHARAALGQVIRELHDAGTASAAAVWPLLALDARSERSWQDFLGTPVDGLGLDRVSVMAYTSIFEGWSRGAVRRSDALALLDGTSARTRRRWETSGGISLGCVGVGAFEDEPVYRCPAELARDVAAARGAGCDDLSLFDLAGVLARPPAEAWLEAFVGIGPPAPVPSTARVTVARRLTRLASSGLRLRRRFGHGG